MLENVEILERDWREERGERESNVAQITRVTESRVTLIIPKFKKKK